MGFLPAAPGGVCPEIRLADHVAGVSDHWHPLSFWGSAQFHRGRHLHQPAGNDHVIGLPEVLLQALLLAVFTHLWVNHPDWKWMGWLFGILFALVVLFSTLGMLAALGILEVPAGFSI